MAAASGRVAFAGWDDGWGLTVTLDHGNGLRTRYAHLSVAVTPGARSRPAPRRPGRRDRLATGPPALRGRSAARTPIPASRPQSGCVARPAGSGVDDPLEAQLERGEVEEDRSLVALLDERQGGL